jgi:hypothetical protein
MIPVNATTPATGPVLAHYQIAYKPFLSIFNMTNLAADTSFQYPQAIVDYASLMSFEVRAKMNNAAGYDGTHFFFHFERYTYFNQPQWSMI